jgi:dTDP-4-dehydrorhamnose 3,5-epimerase
MPRIHQSELILDVVVVEPDLHGDERGRFLETYRRSWFPQGREMVQANRSDKQAGALVGLHYHLHQADYWLVPRGRARVVLHDLRDGSPTARVTQVIELGEADSTGVWIPPGVGHGFAALTDLTIVYLVDGYYNPDDELGVAWDDPDVAAPWGVTHPILSARDRANPAWAELPASRRPHIGLRR